MCHKSSFEEVCTYVVQKPGASELFAFRMLALPFGAVKSVHSFLRVSHSLWFILVKEFLGLDDKLL